MTKIIKTEIIEIEYESKDKKEVDKIKKSIKKNYIFLQDIISPYTKISFIKTPGTIQVTSYEEFKEFISSKLQDFLDKIKESFSKDNEINDVLYLKFMLLDKYDFLKNYNQSFKENEDLDAYINSIYILAASSYYDNQKDLLNFIFELPSSEKDKILTDLLQKRRIDLLNYLLQEQYDLIVEGDGLREEYDSFLKNHISEILAISEIDFLDKSVDYSEEKEKIDLPKLTKEELEQYVREFLIKIDPSLKWIKLYNEALQKNRIVYEKINPNDNIGWCCTPYNGKRYISAPLTGTIKDFRCMIHEFMHYIAMLNVPIEQLPSPSLDEYPSLVFETLAINFLREKGYDEKSLLNLEDERIFWVQDNIFDITPVLKMLNDYISQGPLTLDSIKEKNIEQLSDELIIDKLDFEIMFMLSAPLALLEEYPYVLGKYLSTKTLQRLEEDPILIYELFNITENLTSETPESVIRKMNLYDGIFQKPIQYKKD